MWPELKHKLFRQSRSVDGVERKQKWSESRWTKLSVQETEGFTLLFTRLLLLGLRWDVSCHPKVRWADGMLEKIALGLVSWWQTVFLSSCVLSSAAWAPQAQPCHLAPVLAVEIVVFRAHGPPRSPCKTCFLLLKGILYWVVLSSWQQECCGLAPPPWAFLTWWAKCHGCPSAMAWVSFRAPLLCLWSCVLRRNFKFCQGNKWI